ncbi:MAG: Gfo/Idh/MocA family oxidoreductase [Verrucomicrobia bacterium]|nr:Gfo/Idh/MocA family oxidoreductase [Verrucomicrobiota bacterium]
MKPTILKAPTSARPPENRPRIGVIGLGHWGPNHARHFSRLANLVALCDAQPSRLQQVAHLHPSARCFHSLSDMLKRCPLDAIVVATPTSSHEQVVLAALRAGMHVLCEKPLALHARVARRLCAEARRRRRILMVGHTFLFNAGIRYLRDFILRGLHGQLYYLHAKRTHYGLFRPDVNVVWDLASHDVAIFNYLLHSEPIEVSAVGFDWLRKGIHDLSFISLRYPREVMAHIHVSWLDPKKEREIMVVGDRKMAIWQDLASPGPVFIYDRYVIRKKTLLREFGDFQLLPREGDITIPKIEMEEPLLVQAQEFLDAIHRRRFPLSDGRFGASVVRALEAINASIRLRGRPMRIRAWGK